MYGTYILYLSVSISPSLLLSLYPSLASPFRFLNWGSEYLVSNLFIYKVRQINSLFSVAVRWNLSSLPYQIYVLVWFGLVLVFLRLKWRSKFINLVFIQPLIFVSIRTRFWTTFMKRTNKVTTHGTGIRVGKTDIRWESKVSVACCGRCFEGSDWGKMILRAVRKGSLREQYRESDTCSHNIWEKAYHILKHESTL